MRMTGNTIFIPGATSGIGRALAVALAQRGNTVIAGGRRTDELDALRREHPAIDTVGIDIRDPESITAAITGVLARHPELNVLIAMAGVMRIENWRDGLDVLVDAEEVITTNLLGPVRLITGFVDHLRHRPGATVMTVSSGLAFVPLRATPSYNASKAGVHMLTETLRLQLADDGIQVIELQPPSVQTTLLPGQETSSWAMPLDEFVTETLHALELDPDVKELQVERVKYLRYAEARGDYAEVMATLNANDPNA